MKHRTGIFAKTKTMMLMSIRVFLGQAVGVEG